MRHLNSYYGTMGFVSLYEYLHPFLPEENELHHMIQLFPAMPGDHSLFPGGLIRLAALSSSPPLLNNSIAAQKSFPCTEVF